MREYEYITYGIEHFLVDELVAVICQESLESKSYPDGFRRIFDNYRLLRQKFKDKFNRLDILDFPEIEEKAIIEEFKTEGDQIREAFLVEIESNYPNLGIRQIADDYMNKIRSDDKETTEKRVCLYPYIILQARQYDEREYENGTHN